MAEERGTDPNTCRHWVLEPSLNHPSLYVVCFSCWTNFNIRLPFDRTWADYKWNDKFSAWEYQSPAKRKKLADGTKE